MSFGAPAGLVDLVQLIADSRGRLLEVGEGVEPMLGVARLSLIGGSLLSLPGLAQPALEHLAPLIAGEVDQRHVPVSDGRGNAIELRVDAAELSGQRFLIGKLVRVDALLARNHAAAQVELRTRIDSIIGGFAHEVRNPLASILSLTEAAIEDWAELSPQPTDLMRVPQLVQRIELLLKQSLAYGRPRAPERRLHRLRFLVERNLEHMKPVRRERVLPPVDLPDLSFCADVEQISQVLGNLLDNASDACHSRVRLAVRPVEHRRSSVALDVLDDGPGVPDEDRARIFEPFFTTKAQGTGLGLAIARDLARLNGGDVELGRTSDGWTRFTLFLPASHSALRPLEAA